MAARPAPKAAKAPKQTTRKRRSTDAPPPTPENTPLLAELRETTTQRLAALLTQNTGLLGDLGRLSTNGVDTGTVFGKALKRARGESGTVPPPPPPPEKRLKPQPCAASLHTCCIVDGAAHVFGFEPCGGDWRSAGPPHRPCQLPKTGASRDVAVACGWGFTVIVDAHGSVRAGGRLPGLAPGPSLRPLLPKVRILAISAGASHLLLVDDKGRCWSGGDAADWRLGRAGSPEPALIEGLSHIKGVAAGACHSLAFTAKGALYAWGLAHDGRLGITTEKDWEPPTRVDLSNVVDASAGKYHSLVVAAEGVFAFGDNSYGQLGLGHTDDAWAPEKVSLPSQAVCVAAGASHSLVLLADGDVLGFGSDAQGQLGGARVDDDDESDSDTDSTSSSSSSSPADDEVWTPARVPGLCGVNVVALAAGGAAQSDAGHTVAVTAAGAVLCLGAGGLGQLGAGVDSSATPLPAPVRKTAWS